jgi:hypothetical protein
VKANHLISIVEQTKESKDSLLFTPTKSPDLESSYDLLEDEMLKNFAAK